MKVLEFTLPVVHGNAIIVQEDNLPYFYPYLHRHTEAQLTLILEGEGTLVVSTNMHPFKPGDVFLLGANQPHIFKSNPNYFLPDSTRSARSLTVFFDPDGKLMPLFALPEMQLLNSFVHQHAGGGKIPAEKGRPVLDAIKAVHHAIDAGRLIAFLHMLQVIYNARENLIPLTSGFLDKMTDTEGIRIGNIYNYALQNYQHDITLTHIAAQVHMTAPAFCRYFKKHTGSTFVTFLNQLRVNEVCKKMASGKFEGIASVAYSCGFNSITNFNKIFKEFTGNAPRSYLNKLKGEM